VRILIAEDDKDTASSYKTALEEEFHEVLTIDNGEDCLKVYHEELERLRHSKRPGLSSKGRRHPFDAVLLDYRMPRINGLEVAKEILAVNPHQRIIFASAYVHDALIDSVKQLKQVVELLQKPFSKRMLIDTIQDKEIYAELQRFNLDIKALRAAELNHEQIREILGILKKAKEKRES
jgi:CheY-like chemotaxis protein